jgi:LacI family transcriptional regulator
VPADISICGFGDTLAARTTVPQPTTVRQPLRVMGYRAVELLLERVESGAGRPQDEKTTPLVFEATVIQRGSTAAPVVDRVVGAPAVARV